MPSFHILRSGRALNGYQAAAIKGWDKYMKIRIWTGVITLVLAAVLLHSYLSGKPALQTATQPTAESGKLPQTAASASKAGGEKWSKDETKVKQSEAPEAQIRVLLKNSDFQGPFHQRLEITGTGDFQIQKDDTCTVYHAGEVFTWEMEEEAAHRKAIVSSAEPDGRLQILNLQRSQTPPAYLGSLEITWQEEGYLVINELSLEDYLPSVLSSEMASSFPEEALKAQAISARTYALKWMQKENESCFGADLDDSVSYQVYNNVGSDDHTVQAVRDTAGQVLLQGEELADVFYYSTSCGAAALDHFREEEEFARFLEEGRKTDLEREEPWYRWQTQVSEEKIRDNLVEMGLEAPEKISGISVLQRQENGRAQLIEIRGTDSVLQISGEYEIRRALAPDSEICRMDGSSAQPMQLLPSAWFLAEKMEKAADNAADGEAVSDTVWELLGGGFGHGNGLSQNGAKCMAREGADCEEILRFYYNGIQIGQWDLRGEG